MNREIKFRASHEGRDYAVATRPAVRSNHKGYYMRQGYMVRLVTEHPFADKRGYVLEHRLVMEHHLGRFLKPGEVVHHKDQDRLNNDIGNLELLEGQSNHAKDHLRGQRNPNGRLVASDPIFDEIKFRFLDKNSNLMVTKTLGQLIGTTYRRAQFEFRGRWTGLLDKNGTEIYEGSIMLCVNASGQRKPYVVKWAQDSACFYGYLHGNIASLILVNSHKRFEVIGDIYSTPELLPTKD